MTGGGFRVDAAPLAAFGKHLDELENNLKGTAGVLGSCVADVGMFGIVGQLFGAGASKWCGEAQHQLNDYAGTIAGFSDKVAEAAKKYQAGEADALSSIARFDK